MKIPPVLKKDTTDFHLAPNEYDISKHGVLTAQVVEQIRTDIENTYLPSWLERPPLNFGSPSHGKLKADHWRTVCTISMVITLIRLWSSSAASAADRRILDNFLHLVTAVDLATRRSMDPERARLFDEHMLAYLRSLRELFEHDLVPNHHLSLHLATCLLLFGPVHGWWGFPFERYNGIIQRLNTNNKIGTCHCDLSPQSTHIHPSISESEDIPLTFMRMFYAGAELRWLTASTDWPDTPEFQELLSAFERTYQDAARGTRVTDVLGAVPGLLGTANPPFHELFKTLDDLRLDRALYDQLLRIVNIIHSSSTPSMFIPFDNDLDDKRARLIPHARPLSKFEVNRAIYGTHSKNIRNSFVCFRDPASEDPSLVRAGQISEIFLHRRIPDGGEALVEPFVVLDEYIPLSPEHVARDPYRHYPLLETKLYYNRFLEHGVVIRPPDILCHFAAFVYTPEHIDEPCVVVRSLDRVCTLYTLCSFMPS